jgi:hypothetical protein
MLSIRWIAGTVVQGKIGKKMAESFAQQFHPHDAS